MGVGEGVKVGVEVGEGVEVGVRVAVGGTGVGLYGVAMLADGVASTAMRVGLQAVREPVSRTKVKKSVH
jgi:hypothetical protein